MFFLRTRVTAEVRDALMKWEIVAEIREWHNFRRGVGAGSGWKDDKLAFKINSEMVNVSEIYQ